MRKSHRKFLDVINTVMYNGKKNSKRDKDYDKAFYLSPSLRTQ